MVFPAGRDREMPRANVVEVYELLKPKLGEQESKALLHFIEDRIAHLVRDEIAEGLATNEDIAALGRATRKEAGALERSVLASEWRMRLYLVTITALTIITNSRVLDLSRKLLRIVP